jgi:hypothetical protein
MIICEECGARNRNDAYVCAECEASLLHLEATADDESAPARHKITLFGRRNRQREYDEPEYTFDAGEDIPEPADAAQDSPTYKVEPEEEAEPVRRGLFGRRSRQREACDEPEYMYDAGESMPEPADVVPDGAPYPGEPEEESGLQFVFEEPADEEIPGVESGDKPQELKHRAAPDATENEPEAAPVAEEEQTELPKPQDEMPEDSREIEAPGYAEAEEETTRRTETRPDRSREVHVRVARVKTDRYRTKNAVPPHISADVDEEEYGGVPYDESDEPERMTRGMIAAIVTAASLLVVTLVVLGVLLIGKNRSVPAAASAVHPVVSEIAPAETPAPSPAATPELPIPTTNPE